MNDYTVLKQELAQKLAYSLIKAVDVTINNKITTEGCTTKCMLKQVILDSMIANANVQTKEIEDGNNHTTLEVTTNLVPDYKAYATPILNYGEELIFHTTEAVIAKELCDTFVAHTFNVPY